MHVKFGRGARGQMLLTAMPAVDTSRPLQYAENVKHRQY